ncbi:MAG: hypothetical protein AVDCRST_MAG48-3909, partial [uncultured Friedmanniella sp.]
GRRDEDPLVDALARAARRRARRLAGIDAGGAGPDAADPGLGRRGRPAGRRQPHRAVHRRLHGLAARRLARDRAGRLERRAAAAQLGAAGRPPRGGRAGRARTAARAVPRAGRGDDRRPAVRPAGGRPGRHGQRPAPPRRRRSDRLAHQPDPRPELANARRPRGGRRRVGADPGRVRHAL